MSLAPMTLTSKILYHHALDPAPHGVRAGDLVRVRVDWTIASELAWNGMDKTYDKLGRPAVQNPDRFYLAIDHTVDPQTLKSDKRTQRLVELSRKFANEAQLKYFYDANETILHTTFYRDLVCPGDIVLGADSHTSSHGGVGAFAIGLGGADVTVAMVLGETWIEVPEAIAVEYSGKLPFGVAGKDVILKTLGTLGRNTVAFERTVEFVGETESFSTDMRFTICNMTAEFGGLNGIFRPDGQVKKTLERRAKAEFSDGLYFDADADAPYAERYKIDLAELAPQIAKPFSPDNVFDVTEVTGQALDGVFIGACTTTEEELVASAMVLEALLDAGEEVKPSANRLVVPGNRDIIENLKAAGLISVYERAGFRIGPPGCSMCLGVASDQAGEGEVWLTSQNRNFRNRMGKGSIAWLASGPTVAASAFGLSISDPRPWLANLDQQRYRRILGDKDVPLPEVSVVQPKPTPAAPVTSSAEAAQAPATTPKLVSGRVQRFGDHIDTDAIIPGEFCHHTSLDALGEHCFHHVRPEFAERARNGATIVVAGEAWGTGSSREQAVWALQGAGISLVIAKSYAFIHKRNLVNEALPFLVVRDDAFYEKAEEGAAIEADLTQGLVRIDGQAFQAEPPSQVARALAETGGIVPAIRKYGKNTFSQLQGSA